MNYETQKQFSGLNFNCAFCGYASKLDLVECPGCGRLKRNEKNLTGAMAGGSTVSAESFAHALPVAECYVYVCEHCRYQTFRSLAECPECGWRKFAKFEAPARRRDGADFRSKMTVRHKPEMGKFLLIISVSFFLAAFLTLLGFGPPGHERSGVSGAFVEENWHLALIFFVLGIGSVVAGFILKSRD